MRKLTVIFMIILAFAVVLGGCSSDRTSTSSTEVKKEITVGVTAGPHAQIMDFVAKEAEKQGLKVNVVEFNDYIQPNLALENKEIDINSYQHEPFLNNMVHDKGLHLVNVGKTILLPMGLYSHTYKNLSDLKSGATVAIPNDPTNGGRALLLLQQAGLITLKDGGSPTSSVADIVENSKNLKIQELEAAQIPRSLDDVDVAAVNTNYALNAGLNPLKDAVLVESKDSPYTNIFAVREENKDDATVKKLISIYQSEPVKQFVAETFKGSIITGF